MSDATDNTTDNTTGHTDDLAVEELRALVTDLRRALAEVGGGLDALVLDDPADATGTEVYTLASADRPYRVIVENMGEGALTVSEQGVVLYANPRIASVLGTSPGDMVGRDLVDFVPVDQLPALTRVLGARGETARRAEIVLPADDGAATPYLVTATDVDGSAVPLRCVVFTDLSMQKALEGRVADEAARSERQQVAIEVNDTIVQGLVAAEMAMDLQQFDFARRVVSRTSEHARQWIGRLSSDGRLRAGAALRSHPAHAGEETP